MQSDFSNNLEKWNKVSLESLERVMEINARMFQTMTEKQMESLRDYMSTGVKQVKMMTEAKSPQDLMAGQVRLATEFNEKALDRAKQLTELMVGSRHELKEWFEDSVQSAQGATVAKPASGRGSKKAA